MTARLSVPQVWLFRGPDPKGKTCTTTEKLGYSLFLDAGSIVEVAGERAVVLSGLRCGVSTDCELIPATGPVSVPDRRPTLKEVKRARASH